MESRDWRVKEKETILSDEEKLKGVYTRDTKAWLNVQTEKQENLLDDLGSRRLDGTCKWIFRNSKMISWKDDADGEPILWIQGIPGAGT